MSEGKKGQAHIRLLLHQLKQQVKSHQKSFKEMLLDENISYYDITEQQKKMIIRKIVSDMKESTQGQILMREIAQKVKQQAQSLYDTKLQRHLFLVDCFRQSVSYPTVKERARNIFSLALLDKQDNSRQLRKLIWSRQLNQMQVRQQFSNWDGQVTPYTVGPQIRLVLNRLLIKQQIDLKQIQKDMVIRVLQYFVKKNNKVPQKYHYYIVINVVQLFNQTHMGRIIDLGAMVLSLAHFSQYYYDPNSQRRLANLAKIMSIVDQDLCEQIRQKFLTGDKQLHSTNQLNECYQFFRVSLGRSLLNPQTSQFMIDQIVIRKKCKLDMYILFSIVLLIISDQFQNVEQNCTLKQIIERSKTIIKKTDFIEAYRVIYENIPAYYTHDNLEINSNNRLLAQMLAEESKPEVVKVQPVQDDDFIVKMISNPRIGSKK